MLDTTLDSKKCVILIIEDDKYDVLLLRRALAAASSKDDIKIETVVKPNGMEGLTTVALQDVLSNLPDIVVVDLKMPILDGQDFLRLIRSDFELGALPAVVLTTSTDKAVHDAALAAGADQVFVKPHTTTEFEQIAREILAIGAERHAAGRLRAMSGLSRDARAR